MYLANSTGMMRFSYIGERKRKKEREREPTHSRVCFSSSLCSQLCLTLCDPKDCSPPGSSVHGILKARMLEWVAISSSRGTSPPRDQTCMSSVSCIAGGLFTTKSHQGISYIHIYFLFFFGFPSHLGHHRALSRTACTVQQVLIS